MNLTATRARLEMLTRDLLLQWEETKNNWHDSKSQEFEKLFLQELSARVGRAGTAMEKLDELLTRVRSDCE